MSELKISRGLGEGLIGQGVCGVRLQDGRVSSWAWRGQRGREEGIGRDTNCDKDYVKQH